MAGMTTMLARVQGLKQQVFGSNQNLDVDALTRSMTKLKISLMEHNLFSPRSDASKEELELGRDSLECACMLSVMKRDIDGFERSYAQLKSFYSLPASKIAQSEHKNVILGLNLLQLLARGKVAQFHMEMEGFTQQDCADPLLHFPIELEQSLNEGNHAYLWGAGGRAPHPLYAIFMDAMMGAIRSEIASCFDTAYASLPLPQVQTRLFLNNNDEFFAFAKGRGWMIDTGSNTVVFPRAPSTKVTIPTQKLIQDTIAYARELERII